MYALLRKILFSIDPEHAHKVSLEGLRLLNQLKLPIFQNKISDHPKKIFGLYFKNPIGLAAGLDKNGDYIDALATLGFGFLEIGTVTPKPQTGNARPRLFRLKKDEALINRMGFNSKGVDHVLNNLKKIKYRGVLGINIGKNKETPNKNAVNDYNFLFRKLAPYASYIVINISSPNTKNLRDLQEENLLKNLLTTLKKTQLSLDRYVPLLVKASPDLNENQLQKISEIFLEMEIDGVIATNTSLSRDHLISKYSNESGGLSGTPLHKKSNRAIKILNDSLSGRIPIIGCGGIMDVQSAKETLASGASLLQLYTGLIYQGPGLVREIGEGVKLAPDGGSGTA